MGFGGSVAAMLSSLKSNKRERTSTFELMKDAKSKNKTHLHFDKKASAKELENIRKKLKAENNKKLRINIILFLIALSFLIYVIGFVKF